MQPSAIMDPTKTVHRIHYKVWAQRPKEQHWKEEKKIHQTPREAWAWVDTEKEMSKVNRKMKWLVIKTTTTIERKNVKRAGKNQRGGLE